MRRVARSLTVLLVAASVLGAPVGLADAATTGTLAPPDPPTQVTASMQPSEFQGGKIVPYVRWQPPVNDNGSPVKAYRVSASPGGLTWYPKAGDTALFPSGLTYGTTYTFTVAAQNSATVNDGWSAESEPSSPFTPADPPTKPGAPGNVAATAGDRAADVTWTAAAEDGGSPIRSYRITPTPVQWSPYRQPDAIMVSADQTSGTVPGLTNGVAYTFTVEALNDVGYGAASAPSGAVTPSTVPEAPMSIVASTSNEIAQVSWVDGYANGAPVTGYVVTSYPDGLSRQLTPAEVSGSGDAHWVDIDGLTVGDTYRFTVTAINDRGSSLESALSGPVIPDSAPAAPTGVTATRRDKAAAVTWQVPAPNGGTPVTGYRVVTSPAGTETTVAADKQSAIMTGLRNGTAYSFTVYAINQAGESVASAMSNQVVPAGKPPRMPRPDAWQSGRRKATVAWGKAAGNGAPVLAYLVIPDRGRAKKVPASTRQVTFRYLEKRRYEFRVVAINAVGSSPASLPDVVRIR